MAVVRALFRPQDPDAVRVLRQDAALAAGVGLLAVLLGLATDPDGRRLDFPGWLLFSFQLLPLVWRRRRPVPVLLVHLGFAAPYHALNYDHMVPFTASALAIYTVAAEGPRVRTVVMSGKVIALIVIVWSVTGDEVGYETARTSGWILAVILLGEAVRVHRQYIAAIRERAERAERTREQEAARRVAEERLRIARDLHDLLAHSITLIGVRTSVASHLLIADPGRLDRAALAGALDSIADTCRDARAELRTTLQVLRGDDPAHDGCGHDPLPDLSGIPDLVRTAEEAGAKVRLALADPGPVPPVVGAAAYRIVQEALTNAVRHAGPEVGIEVGIEVAAGRHGPELHLTITDDGNGGEGQGADPGFGITGMHERARSIGGTLVAAPRRDATGFAVTAELPVAVKEKA